MALFGKYKITWINDGLNNIPRHILLKREELGKLLDITYFCDKIQRRFEIEYISRFKWGIPG